MTSAALVLNHIQHVGIPVIDLAKSKQFYEKLGFKKVMEEPFKQENETGTCVMMQSRAIIIELYQMPEKFLGEISSRKNGHIDHIAFDVPDIDAAFRWIKTAGLQPLESEPQFLQFWKNGCKYFNIAGPAGERLEFNQICKQIQK